MFIQEFTINIAKKALFLLRKL